MSQILLIMLLARHWALCRKPKRFDKQVLKGVLEEVMIGSTARWVVRKSKKPVLVVWLPEEEDG